MRKQTHWHCGTQDRSRITRMLARFSIRTKITIVVTFLLIAMSAMGGLAVKQMSEINGSTIEISRTWLPSVRVLGEIRAATITYRAIVRSHLLATSEAGKQAQEVLLVFWFVFLVCVRKRFVFLFFFVLV